MEPNLSNEKLEKLDESGITMNAGDKFFFVNDNDECLTYINSNGIKAPKFINNITRETCIQNILATNSYEIGNPDPTSVPTEGSFLYFKFNGDYDVYKTMMKQDKYDLVWKTMDDIEDESVKELISDKFNDIPKNYTGVVIHINRLDENEILYLNAYIINSFELYCEVLLPWTIENRYKQKMVVTLSYYQKNLLFSKENDIKFDFYPTDNGYEPVILDDDKKCKMLYSIVDRLSKNIPEFQDNKKDLESKKKIIVLNFKNGDRDVISTLSGTIKYKFYEIVDIDQYKDEPYYEQIKNYDSPVIVKTYVPEKDELLHFTILYKKDNEN